MEYTIYQYLNGKYQTGEHDAVCEKQEKSYKKIVVLGGSFNPPTKAHLAILKAAMAAVDAELGLFAPASDKYVAKKQKRSGFAREVFSLAARTALLKIMCCGDESLDVYLQKADDKGRGHNYEMLEEIKTEYPGSEIYFIIGADKLHEVSRWHRIDEFVKKFKFLAADREGENPEVLLRTNKFFIENSNAFVIFTAPESAEDVSSSEFRSALRNGDFEQAASFVIELAWTEFNEGLIFIENSIMQFRGDYEFLSNFYPCDVTYDGLTYLNAEAAFQAQKCVNDKEKFQFCGLKSAQSKVRGREVLLRSDWEDVKYGFMEGIVRAKFTQNPNLAKKLIETGNKNIIEGNTWNDTCWGIDVRSGIGENNLGKILMRVRSELKKE